MQWIVLQKLLSMIAFHNFFYVVVIAVVVARVIAVVILSLISTAPFIQFSLWEDYSNCEAGSH